MKISAAIFSCVEIRIKFVRTFSAAASHRLGTNTRNDKLFIYVQSNLSSDEEDESTIVGK